MSNFLSNVTTTNNGALTLQSSTSKLVDLFFIAGASRNISEGEIIHLFNEAYHENKNIALKILFWSRDIRGGAGERRFFNVILNYISKTNKDLYNKLYKFIPEFGYWKDYFNNIDKKENIDYDLLISELNNKNSLLAKWLPRKGVIFNTLFKKLNYTPKQLRKLLVELSNTTEQKVCSKNFDSINYEQVPSLSFKKHTKTFLKFDNERFNNFLNDVDKGDKKINAGSIFPYELYQQYTNNRNSENVLEAVKQQWNCLPNYINSDESFLPVCDVSGSMSGLPMDISISLGVYISERNKSAFKDTFITFSADPTIHTLTGDIINKFRYLQKAPWGMNTNIDKTFDLILNLALSQNVKQEDLPTNVLIISDMEFDNCSTNFTYNNIVKKFEKHGYKTPKLVFWNVNGRIGNVPVSKNTQNVGLVSGASPSIIKNLLGGKDFTPQGIMLDTVNNERYNFVDEL